MRGETAPPAVGRGWSLPKALALCLVATAAHSATCRYEGTADHGATLAVVVRVARTGGATQVDVTTDIHARFLFWRVRYLIEEVSVWRAGTLSVLGWNYRYLLGERPKRQQWDVFRRTPSGLEAWRIQGPPETIEARHPGFGARWSAAGFGAPWLDDYERSRPERRPDLDLADPGARPPMAELFYWWRGGSGTVRVQLPGFKRDKTAAATWDGQGRAALAHPLLLARPPAGIEARFDAEGLVHADFHGAAPLGGVRGAIDRVWCE